MNYVKRKRIKSDPNLTPLIDIVFLLLIFFMLTAHFVEEKAMDIELPESESSVSIDNDERITVSVDKNGVLYFCGMRTNKEVLKKQITKRFGEQKSKEVYIQGDQTTNLQLILEIMDIAKKSGAKSISIETKEDG